LPDNGKNEKIKGSFDLNKLLGAGTLALARIYQEYLSRIGQGERLKPSELKHFHLVEQKLENVAEEEKLADVKSSKKIIMSFADAAKYCGVSTRTIHYHITKGTISQNDDGTFDSDVLDAYMETRGRKNRSVDGQPSTAIERADLRIKLARARREEMLVRQIQGELFSRKDVAKKWAERLLMIKSGLDNFSNRLPQILAGKSVDEIKTILKLETDQLINDYKKHGSYTPTESIRDIDASAT